MADNDDKKPDEEVTFKQLEPVYHILEPLVKEHPYRIYTGFHENDTGAFTWMLKNEYGETVQERTFPNTMKTLQDEAKRIPYPKYKELYDNNVDNVDNSDVTTTTTSTETTTTTTTTASISSSNTKKGEDTVLHYPCYIEWNQTAYYSANDIYLNRGSSTPENQNMPSSIPKRILYYHYKPKNYMEMDYSSPLIVVLNSPPFTPLVSHKLCEALSEVCECLSIDCGSISKSFIYGIYSIEEDRYMNACGEKYTIADWVQELKSCSNIVVDTLNQAPGNNATKKNREIIIISDMYSTYYATALTGSGFLKDTKCKISCCYLSSSKFPNSDKENKDANSNNLDIINTSTKSIQLTEANVLKSSILSSISKAIDSKGDGIDKYTKSAIKDDVIFTMTLRGIPEKLKFLAERCHSSDSLRYVVEDTRFFNDSHKDNIRYIYFRSSGNTNKNLLGYFETIFGKNISIVHSSINTITINTQSYYSAYRILIGLAADSKHKGEQYEKMTTTANTLLKILQREQNSHLNYICDDNDNDNDTDNRYYETLEDTSTQSGSSSIKTTTLSNPSVPNNKKHVFVHQSLWHKKIL